MRPSRLPLLPLALAAALTALVAADAPPPPPPAAAAAPAPPPGPPPPPSPNQKAEEYYKNIQALKGTPADQLVPAMQFISASLGVDCDFCHMEHAPDKDDKKEKGTARKMIAMTAAINRDSFEGKRRVTCNSCHHGAEHPRAVPVVGPSEEGEHEGDETPPALPAADAVLAKYLQAVGGAEAIGKITSRVQKGNLSGFGPSPMAVEVYAKAPDRRISIVHTPRGDTMTAYDGTAGWLGNGGRPPRAMSAAESEAARLDADLLFPTHVAKLFPSLRVTPGEKIEGKDTVRIVGTGEGVPPVEMFFDAASGLLLRTIRYAETPLGRNPTQIDYADYRAADGVKVPFRWSVSRPGSKFTIEIAEMQQNVPVEDARFAKGG